ncbi:MAG TPA: gephyrin-like molybdotransferase Glp [Rhodocyclaceae bacterium]|nr:gephyrin-like molybdotransferase Glp [Rhodocyclaceae bacterium]
MLSFEDALAHLFTVAQSAEQRPREIESVATLSAQGRILAHDLVSTVDVPPLDNSAMDGYALRCADVAAPGSRLPIGQRIAAGQVGQPLVPGSAARILTGAPVPEGADAVVMQEHCELDSDCVIVNHMPRLGANIRRRAEDIGVGRGVLTQGQRLDARHLGVAASVGAARLQVFRRLRVALFSTGNELTAPGEALKPGGIYNSNHTTLYSLLVGLGCEVTDLGNAPDQLQATRTLLRHAAVAHDLIVTSGGVSVGDEDYVKPAVIAEGRLDLWKIAIKPGKPLASGRIGQAAFIGLPGNPVSSFVTFVMLVRPFILKLQGAALTAPRAQALRAGFAWKGDARREFLRARLDPHQPGSVELFPHQGSGVLTSCSWSDGLIDNPPNTPLAVGDTISFIPFTELL